jgi:4,5-epoxidase
VLVCTGALGDLRERALEPRGMAMHARGRPLSTMRFLPDERESVEALFVSQAMVEGELRRRLGELAAHVEWGTDVRTPARATRPPMPRSFGPPPTCASSAVSTGSASS